MNDRIRHLLAQLEDAEKELEKALQEHTVHLNFSIRGKRVEFEQSVKQAHKQVKIGLIKWLGNRPINLLTAPIIYGMVFPMLLLDCWIAALASTKQFAFLSTKSPRLLVVITSFLTVII